jgi:prepilin-type N-terminal cleavage/methylation domain-containing protein
MKNVRGFTLIELMFVLSIVGILTGLAVGYNTNWRRRNDFNAATREVFKVLNTARSQALYQGRTVTVYYTASTLTFSAFLDTNSNGRWDSGETTVSTPYTLATGLNAATSTLAAKAGSDIALAFDFEGMSRDTSGNFLNPLLTVTDPTLNSTHTIEITVSGAIRIQ